MARLYYIVMIILLLYSAVSLKSSMRFTYKALSKYIHMYMYIYIYIIYTHIFIYIIYIYIIHKKVVQLLHLKTFSLTMFSLLSMSIC